MTDKTSTPDDYYRIPTTNHDGAVEFAPDPETGVEQVGSHLSLEQISHTAAELAISAHPADPNELDIRRLERTSRELGAVIPLAERSRSMADRSRIPPHVDAEIFSDRITSLRWQELDDESRKAA